MNTPINKKLVISCISAAALSITLLVPYALANSHIWNYDSENFMTNNDSVIKNYDTVGEINPASYYSGQSTALLDTDLSEEDFTGDAVSVLDDIDGLQFH